MKTQNHSLKIYTTIFAVLFISFGLFVPYTKTSAVGEASRCHIAQQNLDGPIRDRDLRTRVDRIQAYQYMYQKLDIFVQRLENNDQPGAVDLRKQTDELGKQIAQFRNDYETYDTTRSKVSKLNNCSKNNIDFDRALQNTRDTRAVVHQDVVDLDDILSSSIQNSIRNLYTDLLASSPTGVSNE